MGSFIQRKSTNVCEDWYIYTVHMLLIMFLFLRLCRVRSLLSCQTLSGLEILFPILIFIRLGASVQWCPLWLIFE